MSAYEIGHLRPGDPGYRNTQYDADQAAEVARDAAAIARDRFEGPFTPQHDLHTCEFCGRLHPLQADPLEWECCTARRVWAEGRYEIDRLRASMERAGETLDAVAEREEWHRTPWGVRFDVIGVRASLYASLAVPS